MKSHFHPTAEYLEDRIAPAGVLTVSITGGDVAITGDDLDNDFSLILLPNGEHTLIGQHGTRITLGDSHFVDFIAFTGKFNAISMNLLGGDDTTQIIGLKTKANLDIDLGDGTNSLLVLDSRVGKSFTITGGAGNDSMKVEGAELFVRRDLKINPGGGENAFSFHNKSTQVGRDFIFEGEAGSDDLRVEPVRFQAKSVMVDLNRGDALVLLRPEKMFVQGDVSVAAIPEESELADLQISSKNVQIGDDVTFFARGSGGVINCQIELPKGTIIGSLYVRGTEGDDVVTAFLGMVNIGIVSVVGGSGSDVAVVNIDGGRILQGFYYEGGAKNDLVEMNLNNAVINSFHANMGNGENTFRISGASFSVTEDFQYLGRESVNLLQLKVAKLNIGGDFTYYGGGPAGSDRLELEFEKATVGGDVMIKTGALETFGNNIIKLTGHNFTTRGSFVVDGSEGLNAFNIDLDGAAKFEGGFTMNGGTGYDNFEARFNSLSAPKMALHLGDGENFSILEFNNIAVRRIDYSGGDGSDGLAISGSGGVSSMSVSARRDLDLRINSFSSSLILGQLTILQPVESVSTEITLQRVSVQGATTISLGDGVDSIRTDDSSFGAFVLTAAGGDDQLLIDTDENFRESVTKFTKPVTIDLGAGADSLVIGGIGEGLGAVFLERVMAAGGLNEDRVIKSSVNNVILSDSTFDFETIK